MVYALKRCKIDLRDFEKAYNLSIGHHIDRLNIIQSAMKIGNDAPELKTEMKQILDKLYDKEVFSHQFYSQFKNCAANPSAYAIQFTMQPYVSVSGYTLASGALPVSTSGYTPQLQITDTGSSSFSAIIGFAQGTYPSAPQASVYSSMSNYTPTIDPVQSVIVGLSNLDNPLASNNQVLHSFTSAGVGFGGLINTSQGQGVIFTPMQGSTNEIVLSLCDQNMLPLKLVDPNLCVRLLVRPLLTGSLSIDGTLMVGGIQVVPPPSYCLGITEGSAAASKALVLNSTLDVSRIKALSATSLSGTLQTASQPNITSLGTLTSINTSGSLTMSGVSISSAEISVLDGVSLGTAAPSKALVLNSSSNISGIASLSATSLTGTLQTAAQPNITSVGTQASLTLSGGIPGVTTISASGTIKLSGIVNCNNSAYAASPLSGSLVVSGGIGIQKNIAIGGIASSSSQWALLGIQYWSRATTYTDTSTAGGATVASSVISSYGQPTIASTNSITITRAATIYIENAPAQGTNTMITNSYSLWVPTGKVLLGDSTSSSSTTTGALVITGRVGVGGQLSATSLSASQPNITSIGTLTSLDVSGSISGTLSTAAQPNITPLGNLTNLNVRSGATTGDIANISMPAQAAGYSSWITIGKSSSGNEGGRIGYDHDTTFANQYIYITHNNKSPILTIATNRSVGINNLNPTYDLDVTGQVRITGTLLFAGATRTIPNVAAYGGGKISTSGDITCGGSLKGYLGYGNQSTISTVGVLTEVAIGSTGVGRWGFGTTSSAYGVHKSLTVSTTLDAGGTGVAYFLKSRGLVSTLGPLSAIPIGIGTVGAILAGSGVYTTSDARIKKDFTTLWDYVADAMLKVEPLLFRYKSDDDTIPLQLGYKAQDLIRAGLVHCINFVLNEDMHVEDPEVDSESIQYSVDYSKMVCLLHKLVLRQQKQIEALEKNL
ncbi:unnamed protein product [Phytophthora fragariaefolia]|uniref:Unnamed protein product n=1 Tax=Phytophthora fragariaefolia TaxID=1490495 RepID=A0A9W6U892_9STRA|nr:unnamed protein product [Phytophthora fragariaefolia]